MTEYQRQISDRLKMKGVPESSIRQILGLPYELKPVKYNGARKDTNMIVPSFNIFEKEFQDGQVYIFDSNFTGTRNCGNETYIDIDVYLKDGREDFRMNIEWTLTHFKYGKESEGLDDYECVDTDKFAIKKIHTNNTMPVINNSLIGITFEFILDGNMKVRDALLETFLSFVEMEIRKMDFKLCAAY